MCQKSQQIYNILSLQEVEVNFTVLTGSYSKIYRQLKFIKEENKSGGGREVQFKGLNQETLQW